MAANALLIGPKYTDLQGIERDVAVMTALLSARGFDIHPCVGDAATRAGILAAYEDLIAMTAEGDAVVVYYTGHGGFVENRSASLDYQYLAPTDHDRSTRADFRGITSIELSILQDRLRDRTANVTVILDCCHAGFMSRDLGMRVKSTSTTPQEWIKAHLERLAAAGLEVDRWRQEGNQDVVRVVACAPRQKAIEYENDEGRAIGLLTESLSLAIDAAGSEPVTWGAIMDRVRQRVVDLSYDQRPSVEGPQNRLLFRLEVADLLMSLPVRETGDGRRLRLECAPLLGVQPDDEFAVMPAGAVDVETDRRIGDLVVDAVDPLAAEGSFALAPGRRPGATSLIGARAFRTRVAAPRMPVRVSAADPRSAPIIAALDRAPLVRVAAPDDHDWLAEVRIDADGGLSVCDRIGPLHEPRPLDAGGVDQVMRDLKILAQAAALRRLPGSPQWALRANTNVEWGRVVDGGGQRLEPGAAIQVGDRLYVRIGNDGPEDVYVSIIDIGLSGRVEVVTGRVGGWLVRDGRSYTFGHNSRTGRLEGVAVTWPPGLDRAAARTESLQVYVTSDEQDLRALTQPGIARSAKRVASPLLALLDQLRTGAARDVTREHIGAVRYDVHQFDFEVAAPLGP